jgi:hypothetical protein
MFSDEGHKMALFTKETYLFNFPLQNPGIIFKRAK